MKLSIRPAIVCLVYSCLHMAAHFSAQLFEIAPGISIWYPPCGLALALLVILGPRYAPVVFVANMVGALFVPGYASWWPPVLFPLVITANYTLVAWLVRRLGGNPLLPGSARQTTLFTTTIAVAPIGAALVGTAVSAFLMPEPAPVFLHAVCSWWLGDMFGLLTVVPVAMVYVAPWLEGRPHPAQRWRWQPRFLATITVEVAILVGSVWLVFAQKSIVPHGTLYLCFIPLFWTSLHRGLPGATIATLVVVMGALVGMHFSPHQDANLVSMLVFGVTTSSLGLGLGSAVTRRKDAIAELSSSRARFDRVIEGAKLGLWDWNLETGEFAYNHRCADLLRWTHPEPTGTPEAWERIVVPADRARRRDALQAHLRGETELYECEYRIQVSEVQRAWIQSRGSVVQRTDAGRPALVSGTMADVTARKHAESAAKRLLAILESTIDFVVTIDSHSHIVYANRSLVRLLGLAEFGAISGRSVFAVFAGSAADVLQADTIPSALANGHWHGELTLKDATQREVPVSLVALVHRDAENEGSLLSFVMRDITAQRAAAAANIERERRIQQVQKAQSLGVLAGGIAHDFNNLLTAIYGNASLLREQLGLPENSPGPLTQIEIAAGRAAELCKEMLAYSGRFQVTTKEVNLNAVIQESRELIHAAISRKVTMVAHLGERLPPIKGSSSQLQQAIINLALNANEAIGDRPGTITLRTSERTFTSEELSREFDAPTLTAGRYVLFEVEDSGCGIAPEVREQIFEPFFTTKPKGHGLGLSAVNGIVRAHGGAIVVRGVEPQGAAFQIILPAFDRAAAANPPQTPLPENWRGSGMALIVDDEEMVRTVVALAVEKFGFKTVTACDGVEAVASYRQHHAALAFVLTDLTMPRMGGDEAMMEMRRIDPSVPIILMSGYLEKMNPGEVGLSTPSALLAKPIRIPVLQKTLSQILGHSKSSSAL